MEEYLRQEERLDPWIYYTTEALKEALELKKAMVKAQLTGIYISQEDIGEFGSSKSALYHAQRGQTVEENMKDIADIDYILKHEREFELCRKRVAKSLGLECLG